LFTSGGRQLTTKYTIHNAEAFMTRILYSSKLIYMLLPNRNFQER